MASTFGGVRGQTDGGFTKRVRETLGLPFAFLSDDQWNYIAELAGLMRYVRFDINIALQDYWQGAI
jgi:hypothetical protein